MNTERMSCGEAREKLPLYVGGDLDRDVLDAVRTHLESCGECARRGAANARARRELVSAFRASEADVENPELWPGIRAVLRAEGLIRDPARPLVLPTSAARPSGVRRLRWALALAPLAAAAAVFAIVELSGFSAGKSVPPELAPSPRGEIVMDRELPEAVVPVGGGLQRVSPDEAMPRLIQYPSADQLRRDGARVRRLEGTPPGAPVFSVGLRSFQ